jgi:E3 ubiquitin-protein ligase listerin
VSMSKRAFKSQASSARAASSAFGSSPLAFGAPQVAFQTAASHLSYITEQPDLSGISNPQVVVAFKNLGKKDRTTKAKALEELQEHLSAAVAQNVVETAVLEAWVNLYPRTSIDNSRRVRQLAHTLQGWITVSAGKRIVPFLPKVVGSWLAGTYDSDKGVARSAQDALQAAFSTPEKRGALWKVYRTALLEYVEDAMLVQSQQTLSDERTTSPDDSEAKHVRVVSTAALILLQLIKGESLITSKTGDYAKLLSHNKLWEYAYHKDASMRRAVYALILPTVTSLGDHLDFKIISTCFLAKSLHIDQLGSSSQYVEAILALTQHRPQLWTTDYTSKTSASRRLLQLLKKGSQRGAESFWARLSQLIRIVPVSVWSSTTSPESSEHSSTPSLKDAESLLEAMHEGVMNTDEPRQNASAAWSAYAGSALWLVRDLKIDDPQTLLEKEVYPIIEQHISNVSANTQWSISATHSAQICARILVSLTGLEDKPAFVKIWTAVSADLIESVKISLPESSKDYRSSQDAVIAKASRLFKLQEQVIRSATSESTITSKVSDVSSNVIEESIKILRDRNGKPYSAAGTIAAVLSAVPADSRLQPVEDFLASDLSSLLATPSGSILISILLQCKHYWSFRGCFERCVKAVLEQEDSPSRDHLLIRLLRDATPADLSRSPDLEAAVTTNLNLALSGDSSRWQIVEALVGNSHLSLYSSTNGSSEASQHLDIVESVLSTMMNSLSIEDKQDAALVGFKDLLSDSAATGNVISTDISTQLLPKLLLASDSPSEDTAKSARELSLKLRSLMKKSGSVTASSSTSELLHQQFQGLGQMISVFGMVELAELTLKDLEHAGRPELFASLLPSAEQWQTALKPFVDRPAAAATAITSPLQGVVFAIDQDQPELADNMPRDSDDFSIAMRLAVYVTKLLASAFVGTLDLKQSKSLYLYYPQALQLINMKITIDSSSELWLNSTPEVIDEAVDVLSRGQKLIREWVEESVNVPEGVNSIVDVWQAQISSMKGASPQAYILGLCFSYIMTDYIETLGPAQSLRTWKNEISSMHRSNDIVQSAALVSVLQDVLPYSAEGKKLCNELIAVATGLESTSINVDDLRPLVLLNMILHGENDLLTAIPTQRVVFLFRNLTQILVSGEATYAVQSEVYKLLCFVVVTVSDIYGDYWEQILDAIADLWEGEKIQHELPALYSSLSLYARLRSLLGKEPNEDLIDAWKARKSRLDAGLVAVLMAWAWDKENTGASQPRDITVDSLSRQLRTIDVASVDRVDTLYPLLRSEQHSVQTAAYELLHRAVPAQQEQISIDLALEKQGAHLPPELLSLIASFPSLEGTSKNQLAYNAGAGRSYLLSWTVLFDNFTNASFKLREMYHQDIKSSGHMVALLDTICSILRITSGRPVDASKFDVTSISLQDHDLLDKEAQSLAIYLYYQSLLHVPDLLKEWFIEQKNRIKSPLETWTQKHISPLIVTASLQAATEWAATQDQDDRPVSIKASPKGSELVASIAIDEESPPISLAVSLPGAYPLEQAIVTSRNRVGVSDKNWQSWMRTFQIIIFSTGNLIEGLIAFRRNVQGALRGQTECAICYSIIGTDMRTPDKKCGTCKNTFHSVCLFRWFKSSNSSSCPLCRNNFNYA